MTEALIERLNTIADGFGISGIELVRGVNFEWDCPEDVIEAGRTAIVAEYGYISESIVDELLAAMSETNLYND